VRQLQAAALMQARRLPAAEAIYREDLKRRPNNGWSLFGLLQCLRAQGQTEAAASVDKQLRETWKNADFTLTASCF
jgi:tetratricopeptide (TPR) repeat protein